ncbi:MAG: hypothetical protein GX868_04410 [Actinobacteria bacterium]|nr:hypothetical protein [Actinomycetota bacterium]
MKRAAAQWLKGRDGETVEEVVVTTAILAGWILVLIADHASWWTVAFFALAGIACNLLVAGSFTRAEHDGDALVLHRANRLRPVRLLLSPGQNVTFKRTMESGSRGERYGDTAVYVDDQLIALIQAGRDGLLVRGRVDAANELAVDAA